MWFACAAPGRTKSPSAGANDGAARNCSSKVHSVSLEGVFLGCKYEIPGMVQMGCGATLDIALTSRKIWHGCEFLLREEVRPLKQ